MVYFLTALLPPKKEERLVLALKMKKDLLDRLVVDQQKEWDNEHNTESAFYID